MPPTLLTQGNTPTSMTNVMNRPASAYYNSNSSNVMNLSSPSTPNIPNSTSAQQHQPQSTSSMGNLMQQQQAQASMMPYTAHPNLSGMSNASSSITNSPITAHRPPMIPNKQQQQMRMGQQQQMMAPSMPNIAHASGYASNIPASQSMQNVNVISGNFPMYQQHDLPPQQHSPGQQASLLRGTAKMAEMSEMLKRQQNNQRPSNGPLHFANSMDNIHIPPPMLSPSSHPRSSAAQVFHPQSPQKSHAPPSTAPKPQVECTYFYP